MPIKIKSSGGGSVSFDIPNTGSDYTLTAPANNATIFTSAGGTVTGNVAFTSNNVSIGGQTIAPNFGMKNRVINGDMRIDQRYNGSSVTVSTDPVYVIDRWRNSCNGGGAFSVQRVLDAPDNFKYSQKITVTTIDSSIGSTEYYAVNHVIEGNNIDDLGWGTAAAKTVTISFWVKCSITGTFAFSISNGQTYDRTYVTNYTINAANTWEYKTVTIPGSTGGTWHTGNDQGLYLLWTFGEGTGRQTSTPDTWVSGSYSGSTSSSTKMIQTLGATWQLTGVQFEVGTIATPFERRHYENELILCQRYYHQSAAPGESLTGGVGTYTAIFYAWGTYEGNGNNPWPVQMRAAPTVTHYDNAGVAGSVHRAGIGDATGTGAGRITVNGWQLVSKTGGWSAGNVLMCTYKADAEI